ncbi:hypothetical protein MKX01_010682 [Papaver californicum]|nr:hypothetical protein MKX01_010682 [Papaver californicum]
MDSSSKQQMVSNFAITRIVVALILCLLFVGVFSYSVEAAGRINKGYLDCHTVIEGRCVDDQDCTSLCKSKKYSDGKCYPNDWDENP